MHSDRRLAPHGRLRRAKRKPLRTACVLLAGLAVGLAACPSALATQHDYCHWDGSSDAIAANSLCFAGADEPLTNNYAYLVFAPTTPTIFCGAYLSGAQYAGYSSGNPSCNHTYSGANLLTADEYVSVAATTHGVITY